MRLSDKRFTVKLNTTTTLIFFRYNVADTQKRKYRKIIGEKNAQMRITISEGVGQNFHRFQRHY